MTTSTKNSTKKVASPTRTRVAKPDLNKCQICKKKIQVAIFKGTGVCCENHRKERDGE